VHTIPVDGTAAPPHPIEHRNIGDQQPLMATTTTLPSAGTHLPIDA